MNANDTNKIVYKELSYQLNGILFQTHNELGRYQREKQYADYLEQLLQKITLPFRREKAIRGYIVEGYIPDFVVDEKIVIEIKAKPVITKQDYYQMRRYLQAGGFKLGLLVNFRNRYLKPTRVVQTKN